jgi:nitrite reductase/ring-hydroxylating ferredoxin subunit
MAARARLICRSADLVEGGDGVRFPVVAAGGPASAFAVRYNGRVCAWLNRCAHVPVELDWEPGRFFDMTGTYLICAVHGAHYEPRSGRCVMGPCKGRGLVPVVVTERDGNLYLMEDDDGQRRQA